MEDYLIDRETLGRFVEMLIQKKQISMNETDINSLKEKTTKELDDKISQALLECLSDEQLAELENMLDSGEQSTEAYERFYRAAGINTEQIIKDTAQKFAQAFLGGQNG